ncbi:hypothetical protein SmJEL517_g05110 [Synchytrium microbalum]|uniref:RTA1 like protein n=1 Tax=Synchytrium microbalum TaxID=1806994 RepID=A0A507BVR9_9FUNG|nr:uncharacterized protein SmJEL517_g05110 [Synchytrium microbalum]TPX31582.1 hypothetical protein SmJEL517_g05110 [Synchytrium microbalum]
MSNTTVAADRDLFGYDPSVAAAAVAMLAFLFTGVAHSVQMYFYRPCWYMILMAIGAFWELIGFGMRINAASHVTSSTWFAAQQSILILAPVIVAAGDYMILTRIIRHIGVEFSPVNPKYVAPIFVGMDILSFVIQGGGSAALVTAKDQSTLNFGLYSLLAGLAVQVFSIACFLLLAVIFQRRARVVPGYKWRRLMAALYVSAAFILIRSIYRVAEFAQGFLSPISKIEGLLYTFDTAAIFVALAVFNIVHPGNILVAPKEGDHVYSMSNRMRVNP